MVYGAVGRAQAEGSAMVVDQQRELLVWIDGVFGLKIRADTPLSGAIATSLVETPVSESTDGGTTSVPKNLSTRPSVYARRNGGKS